MESMPASPEWPTQAAPTTHALLSFLVGFRVAALVPFRPPGKHRRGAVNPPRRRPGAQQPPPSGRPKAPGFCPLPPLKSCLYSSGIGSHGGHLVWPRAWRSRSKRTHRPASTSPWVLPTHTPRGVKRALYPKGTLLKLPRREASSAPLGADTPPPPCETQPRHSLDEFRRGTYLHTTLAYHASTPPP